MNIKAHNSNNIKINTNQENFEKCKTIVYFVRHGERLEFDKKSNNSRIPGPALSQLGHKQAKHIAKKFKQLNGKIDAIFTSTMTRAQETAKYIGEAINKKPIIHEKLCEFNKFLWTGKFYHPNFWKQYIKYRNAQNKFNHILKEYSGKTIILVGHGNVMKGIISKKLGVPLTKRGHLAYDNCAVSKIRFKGTKLDYIYYYNSSQV